MRPKNKNQRDVSTIKYGEMTVFGIESISTQNELQGKIRQLQNTYRKIQNSRKSNRKTIITMIHALGDSMYHVIVAGYIKRAEFQSYKIPASVYAMVTVRGFSKRKLEKMIQNTEEFFKNNWLLEHGCDFMNTEYIFWYEKDNLFFRKKVVDVLFEINGGGKDESKRIKRRTGKEVSRE